MNQTDFSDRHIGPDDAETSVLLKTLGLPDLEALADAAIPSALRAAGTGHQLDLPAAGGLAELDVPSYLLKLLPVRVADRFDPRIVDDEQARSRLLMMTNFLNLWETNDFVGALDAVAR